MNLSMPDFVRSIIDSQPDLNNSNLAFIVCICRIPFAEPGPFEPAGKESKEVESLAEAIDDFHRHLIAAGRSTTTIKSYQSGIERLLAFLGDKAFKQDRCQHRGKQLHQAGTGQKRSAISHLLPQRRIWP
jgi:hypothetical protein